MIQRLAPQKENKRLKLVRLNLFFIAINIEKNCRIKRIYRIPHQWHLVSNPMILRCVFQQRNKLFFYRNRKKLPAAPLL